MDDQRIEAWLNGAIPARSHAMDSDPKLEGDRTAAVTALIGAGSKDALTVMENIHAKFGKTVDPKKMTDEELEEFLENLRTNPYLGLTTVTSETLKRSGWKPDLDEPDNDPKKFEAYIQALTGAPCILFRGQEKHKVDYAEKDYDDLIDQAVELFKAATGEDPGEIRDSLVALAKTATRNVDTTEKVCILSNNVIKIDSGASSYNVWLTLATMKKTKGKASMMESSLLIYSLALDFNEELWKAGVYKQIGRKLYHDYNDWADDMNAKANSADAKLCIEKA